MRRAAGQAWCRATFAVARADEGARGMMRAMNRLLRLRDDLLAAVAPLGPEDVPLAHAGGRYLARPALATVAAPPFICSAMDGYAVHGSDVTGPVSLDVAGRIYAGDAATMPLPRGSAARIFTGAPLPPGADTVVREEATRAEDGRVVFLAA